MNDFGRVKKDLSAMLSKLIFEFQITYIFYENRRDHICNFRISFSAEMKKNFLSKDYSGSFFFFRTHNIKYSMFVLKGYYLNCYVTSNIIDID